MADDRDDPRQEDEFKVTVRDRRRINLEGELREVEEAPQPAAPPEEPAPPAEPRPTPPTERSAPHRGGALGGAQQARRNRGVPLREVPVEEPPAESAEGEGERRVRDVYEYVQALASELGVWSLASLGLMPHPATRIITVDMDQAAFALDAAEALLGSLVEHDRIDSELLAAVYQSFVIQFGGVAAQLMQQPTQSVLQELPKIRFCIDTADRFAALLTETTADAEEAIKGQVAEVTRFLKELRLAYVQASGGGGVVG